MRAGAARAARGAGKLFANILFVPLVRRETSLNQDRVVAVAPGPMTISILEIVVEKNLGE